ncbi:hypothetical protein P152DRAFT_455435 [Eremomyces bilateralis CBS 781.70]|uniref:Gcp-like domain-containing protein n=1 Tax=Eremomyces bilateralis CBS 781.70 TaxID=1392243 RepID=A0A6G1GC90_9PEZI|nr:uncharacterized protein P152DRAFT_455435 [Eremomyces bilateralis CBS 781.70]KAF1815718.1 hypothetical protein P152DRAFT_455435 [Eremomyces bilateralis CBS 781.70]
MSLFYRSLQHAYISKPGIVRPRRIRTLLTLAVESSCDDSAVAILETHNVKSSLIASQSPSASSPPTAHLHFNHRISATTANLRGIHPVAAAISHQRSLASLLRSALPSLPDARDDVDPSKTVFIDVEGKLKQKCKPDFIAVTSGPGMISSLTTGIENAKGLAVAWGLPIVGVHHMQAHALTPQLVHALESGRAGKQVEEEHVAAGVRAASRSLQPAFPFLSLLVSGGHTILVDSKNVTQHRVLAKTADNAVGDALDKMARMILPEEIMASEKQLSNYGAMLEEFVFPGSNPLPSGQAGEDRSYDYGYAPSSAARRVSQYGWALPIPLAAKPKSEQFAFSFAGLISAMERNVDPETRLVWNDQRQKNDRVPRTESPSEDERRELGKLAMTVTFDHLARTVIMGLEAMEERGDRVGTLVVAGGVSANQFLKHVLRVNLDRAGFGKVEIETPPLALCTDNAAMIAWAGSLLFEEGFRGTLGMLAKRTWSLDDYDGTEVNLSVFDGATEA